MNWLNITPRSTRSTRRRLSNVSSVSSTQSGASSLADSATFSQRIVSVDFYTAFPITGMDPLVSEFRGSEVKRVPVIRIYGATPRGQKTCTHVHGVFPYLYIEDTVDDPDFVYSLAFAVDSGINAVSNYDGQHVYKIQKVIGRSFYGYKSSVQPFLQVYFYSPHSLKKGVELLESGRILGQRFQPYEAHIPYILQFFLDFKLYGMNFIHFKAVKFRRPDEGEGACPSSDLLVKTPTTTGSGSKTYWDLETIREDLLLPPKVLRRSRVELEVDAKSSDILVSSSSRGKNPGIVNIWLDEKERRRQHSVENWADITIPQSPDRYDEENNFIFPRESELLGMLGDYLKGESQSEVDVEPSELALSNESRYKELGMESDNDIASQLENVAFEEGDSILQCSQPPLGATSCHDEDALGGLQLECAMNKEGHKEDFADYEMEDEWAEDFLSQATIDQLEKWEREFNEPSDSMDKAVHQCDGQFDSSDSDDDETPKRRRLSHNSRRATLQSDSCLSRQRFKKRSIQNSTTQLQLNRHPSQLEIELSNSDSDCQIVSVVESPHKKPQQGVTVTKSDATLNSIATCTTRDKRLNTCSSRKREVDKDSGITSFYDVSQPPEEIEINSDTDTSQEILPSTPPPREIEEGMEQGNAGSNQSQDRADDFIMSIYKYEDKSSDEDERSQSESSIVSCYEYLQASVLEQSSQCPNSEAEGSPERSFQNIVVDYSVPLDSKQLETTSHQSQGSPFLTGKSQFYDEALTLFQAQRVKHQLSKKVRRQRKLERKEKIRQLRPSTFLLDLKPLKQAPLFSDIRNWCINNEPQVCNHEIEGIRSIKYLEDEVDGCKYRKSLIEDVLCFTHSLEEKRRMRTSSVQTNGKLPEPALGRQESETSEVVKVVMVQKGSPRSELTKATEGNYKPNEDDDASSIESDDEAGKKKVNRFRFLGALDKSESGSSSNSDNDDDRTMVASPASVLSLSQNLDSPMVSSQGSITSNVSSKIGTPKSTFTDRKKSKICARNKLEFNLSSPSNVPDEVTSAKSNPALIPNLHPDDSELDSLSILSPSSRDLNSSNMHQAKASHEHQFLTTLAVEVLCGARGDFVPDPEHDSINAIFFAFYHDSPENSGSDTCTTGIYFVDPGNQHKQKDEQSFEDEISMFKGFINFIYSLDPDILLGYEIEKFSWGYLIQRGFKLGLNLLIELSRLITLPNEKRSLLQEQQGQWNETINGRIVLNLWKLLRHEVAVTSYTFESMIFHILHEKVHRLSYKVLDSYWKTPIKSEAVKRYFFTRVKYSMRMIDKLDLINRTSELARLFGIQFFEVLSRGSQFRVESMMLRMSKLENLIPPSPNPLQRAKMRAPEYLPLILEPESNFYKDPVAVLDFQSLYPSMMIAYNYCFSTCIGRIEHIAEDTFELGCLSQSINRSDIRKLYDEGLIHISPCRVAFVKSQVRKGILSTMLEQILDTRQMVKRSMKKWKDNETLQKVLDSRQLGLKLIANVTYGYTSANWSGRMACVEIADSIVSKGRETLQRAIDYVNQNEHIFGGRVVYGDTDSLFIHYPGKTREHAFRMSQRIVEDVTQSNPKPVKLKLEKVYQPCILQTKKRYVGFAYESPCQVEPKYDAKGIETVRRDGCPATAKILEGAIRVLFTKQNEESVKKYVTEQFRKIFLGRVSLSKYTFARKFRGKFGYKPGARVPSLEIAKKLAEVDKRAEPLPKERVPYIVIYGDPWAPLIQRIRRPEEFISDPNLRLNAHYYIEKAIIPALNRCLNLAGFNAEKWLNEMPRRYLKTDYVEGHKKKGTIDQYFTSQKCIKCESRASNGFCQSCFKSPQEVNQFLTKKSETLKSRYESCLKICQDCSKEEEMLCINMDCPVKHKYLRYNRDFQAKLPKVKELQNRLAVLDW